MIAPLSWIRRISSEISESNVIPLFGKAPPFDWGRLSSLLASRFTIPHLTIHAKEQTWREPNEMRKGLGSQVLVDSIVVSPVGTVFWIMSQEDMAKFTSWILNPKGKTKSLTSEILQEGFYRYLLLEVLETLQGMPPLKDLTVHLSEEDLPPAGKTFCIDFEIEFDHRSCWGRLAIPSELRTAWIQHFEQMPSEYVPSELSRQLNLQLGVKTGSVLLHQDEWKNIKKGDFVALDRGSYDPRHDSGIAMLTLGPTPLFNVKIKQNKIELVDYAFYYEENMPRETGETPQEPTKLEPAEGEVVALKELPLYVNIEIARVKMTLDQLMHLNPGNVLELPVHPDQSVSLVVNGQKVGRGELVYLGETLGLRIIEIG